MYNFNRKYNYKVEYVAS